MAFIPASSLNAPGPEQIYDQHAETYPTGGSFEYTFSDSAASTADEGAMLSTTINFVTASRDGAESNSTNPAESDLLMLSLPHHQASFIAPRYADQLTLDTLVGDMVGVLGQSWSMATQAVPSSYASFRTPREVDPEKVDAIKMQVLKDIQSSSTAGEPDPYGFGKSLSKLGRMALIAEELNIDSDLIQDLLAKMKDFVAPWLDSSNPDQLFYDTLYGGIVSNNGVKDPAQDFGQGYYNDHHFHYGQPIERNIAGI
jgi:endo-1,3(4)-beta-glucanase